MNEDKILQRILKTAGSPTLLEALTNRLSLADLQSLLLAVYRTRAAERTSRELLGQYRTNRFVRPSAVSPVESVGLDHLAFSLLPADFEAVELSPLSPLGACSVLGPVSQNNVVTTVRNTEACADATNALALECAARLKRRDGSAKGAAIKLCASQRVVRAQEFSGPASFPHFRILSLCTSGRDRGSFDFQTVAVKEHIRYYVSVLLESRRLGLEVAALRLRIMPFSSLVLGHLKENGIEDLSALTPQVKVEIDEPAEGESAYYTDLRFQIYAADRSGKEFFLVDGGLVPWMQKLLSDRKECLITSGMGTERFLFCFHPASES